MMKKDAELDAMKPDDGEHHPGQRGNTLKQGEDRRQEVVDGAGAHHQQRERRADDERTGKSGQDAQDGRQHVGEHRAVGKDFEAAPEHIDQRRKQEPRKEQRGELPEQNDHDERQHRRSNPFQCREQRDCQR
jgi:hypothetical protein